jgi:hypothetical protein
MLVGKHTDGVLRKHPTLVFFFSKGRIWIPSSH